MTASRPLRVLIVKLSSLGDVVHTLPVVADILAAHPQAQIDWVVERGFAPLVARCQGVARVIEIDQRRWRRQPWAAATRAAWRTFREALSATGYDAVLDLQGLTKSALVARLARLAPSGRRYAIGNRTDGASYERPTRWLADVAIAVAPHTHALTRARVVAAEALGYVPGMRPDFGLGRGQAAHSRCVALVHGTSRTDKEWPLDHWLALGRRLLDDGFALALPQGSEPEARRAEALAEALPGAQVWPRLSLDALMDEMAPCAGVIGVDSGLSHIAVALDLPHVQLYNFDTAWRTGPLDVPHQQAVFAQPAPTVEQVWRAWQQCWQVRERDLADAAQDRSSAQDRLSAGGAA